MSKQLWEQLPTLQSKQILSELMEAGKEPQAKILIANTGNGKTNTIRMYKEKNPDNTFVVTLGASYTRNDMLDEICDLVNARNYLGGKYYGRSRVRERLLSISRAMNDMADKKPVLILDEFENARVPVLKSIKELYDAINMSCSIVLIGTEQLLVQLEKKSTGQSIPQLKRRFKAGTRIISPIKKARDFRAFFDKYIPKQEGIQSLLLQLADNYGELHDYLYPVLSHADKTGKPLTEEMFRMYHKITGIA